jgi:hypothetical protein
LNSPSLQWSREKKTGLHFSSLWVDLLAVLMAALKAALKAALRAAQRAALKVPTTAERMADQ